MYIYELYYIFLRLDKLRIWLWDIIGRHIQYFSGFETEKGNKKGKKKAEIEDFLWIHGSSSILSGDVLCLLICRNVKTHLCVEEISYFQFISCLYVSLWAHQLSEKQKDSID